MSARVIAGSAKGRKLKLVPGDSTRPIMDRVKEALFSIIGREIQEASFLDLFAGTGSVGIEALSRGAKQAVFLDLDRKAIETIQDNLKVTNLADRATVKRVDAFAYLRQVPPAEPFDFIYVAPPQYKGMWEKALTLLDEMPAWIGEYTQVIVQIDPSERSDAKFQNLLEFDERIYGKTILLFFQKPSTTEEEEELSHDAE